jgi:hypothetical protein
MRVKLIRGCLVPGFPSAQPGQIIDVPPDVAQDLLAIRKAVLPPETIEVREPEVENRDPQPVEVRQVERTKSKVV